MVQHPYLPSSLKLAVKYQEAALPLTTVLGVFFCTAGVLLVLTWLVTGRVRHMKTSDRLVAVWMLLSGLIHLVVEGAYALNPTFYASTSGNLFDEIWKEYSKADSRYAARDPFVLCMETVTAFIEGPLCLLAVIGLLRRCPWRHAVIFTTSLGEFYGTVLYYASTLMEGAPATRPEPLYFWFYFVAMNVIWMIVPFCCLFYSGRAMTRAVQQSERLKQQ